MSGLKTAAIVTGAVAVAYGVYKITGFSALSDKIDVSMTNSKVSYIGIKGIEFRTDVLIKNPRKETVKITQPYVKLYDKENNILASSEVTGIETEIKPLSQTTLPTISLSMGLADSLKVLAKAIGKSVALADLLKLDKAIFTNLILEYSFYANNVFISQKENLKS